MTINYDRHYHALKKFMIMFCRDGVWITRIGNPETEGEGMQINYDTFEAWLEKLWEKEF